MIIKSLHINNIRTYKNKIVNFEKDVNFLFGDIGSGKTTILMAIEFLFFGFKKNEIESKYLLRKGEISGFVEIEFIDKKSNLIKIKRNLKKNKKLSKISQENGEIFFNNEKKILTPNEITNFCFKIFNFPKHNKNKNLIYRFVNYTPQNQLNEIIFCEIEKRIDIIRDVFDLKKYNFINNSIDIYSKKIKKDIEILENKLERKNEIEIKNEDYKNKIYVCEKEVGKIENKENFLENEFKKLDFSKNKINEKHLKLNDKKNKILRNVENFENKKKELVEINSNIFERENIIKNTEKICEKDLKNINQLLRNEIKKYEDFLNIYVEKKIEEKYLKVKSKIEYIENLILDKKNLLENISNEKICSTCFQEIDLKHKEKILKNIELEKTNLKNYEDKKIKLEKWNYKYKISNEKIKKLEKEILENNNKISKNEKTKFIENEILNLKIKKKDIKNFLKNIEKIENDKKELKKDEGELNIKKNENENELNKINLSKKENIIEQTKFKTNIKFYLDEIKKNKIELEKFLLFENEIKKLEYFKNLLNVKLIKINSQIEKKLFTKFYIIFNENFISNFEKLIQDSQIEVRLDFDFSIIVEQNGFDIELKNLSGGEKTTISLAYKLALKKTIESDISNINNLEILILDEPTEGFSKQQISNLGNLLKEINSKQIIVVSHDIEFSMISNNILNLTKKNHETLIN